MLNNQFLLLSVEIYSERIRVIREICGQFLRDSWTVNRLRVFSVSPQLRGEIHAAFRERAWLAQLIQSVTSSRSGVLLDRNSR